MQAKKWVRVGLAGVISGSAVGGALAAGCGGNDQGGGANNGDAGDSSTTGFDVRPRDDTGIVDTGLVDTGLVDGAVGADSEAAAPPVFAKVYLVNASVDPLAPPLRFCFGLGNPADAGVSVADSIPPFPDQPVSPAFPIAGLFPGFGGSVASSPKLSSFDLSKLTVSLYAVDATKIAGDTVDGSPDGGPEGPCEGLIGTDALGKASDAGGGTLTAGTDFWYLGTVSALPYGSSWIAAVTGCAPGETVDNVPFCEPVAPEGGPPALPAYSTATGNLTLTAWRLDSTTDVVAATAEAGVASIAAQFANASPAWDYSVRASGGSTTAAGFWTEAPVLLSGTDGGLDAGGASVDGGLPDSASLVDGSLVDGNLLESGSLADSGFLDSGSLVDSGLLEGGSPATMFSFFPITAMGTFGTLSPPTLDTTAGAALPLNASGAGFAALIPGSGGTVVEAPPGCTVGSTTKGCFSPLLFPLPDIDAITNGAVLGDAGTVTTPLGGSFVYGKGYVFVLVGDPNQASTVGGVFNGKSLHFLAFPTSNP